MIMQIVKVPSPILHEKVKPVISFDKKLQKTVKDMIQTLQTQHNPEGVGLAAPQVGLPYSIFIIKPDKKSVAKVFINTEILKTSINKTISEKKVATPKSKRRLKKSLTRLEGCLSINTIWGKVKRASRVFVHYQDITGKIHEEWFCGFESIIIQHEVDHLQGILFTQKVLNQGNILYTDKDGDLKEYEI